VKPKPPVVYVAEYYPKLAQTFTTSDVRALHAAGLLARVASMHRPSHEDPKPDATLDPPIDYFPLPFGARVVAAWSWWLLRRPIQTLRISLLSLTRYTTPFSWPWQVRAPLHVLWGAFLARHSLPGTHFHAQFVGAASTVAWVASRLARGTFSMTAHQDWGLPWIRRKVEDATFVIAISEKSRREILACAPGVPQDRVVVNHVGVPLVAASDAPRRDGHWRLLAVGSAGPTKGHDVLIRACALLRDRGVGFRLDLVGGGEGLAELRELVTELGLEASCVLHGALAHADVRRMMVDADVVVLACRVTSRGDSDGIPVALMEGMAAGKATVSTSVGAISELIEDDVSGRLVAPERPDALSDALAEILANEPLRRRLGAGGRVRIADAFDAGASARGLVVIFESRLGSADTSRGEGPRGTQS
jgi:glycosyltransferase involved in cell wall biosynthesis